ncbi:hypothetical protein [Streptomyces poonensis]|uniref:Uncharacterized protein n=1 Tax=Streptomyces poonensis TaxID=68255 RepID=A0A918PA11_9ACTN|nr:hypothetical protein [Streptomyces poonensis]GGY94848.1 hypothetical protein GCM10010365_12040 [Streptomyces poonensis]GLJ88735.1 hypothetical protein GCM10017589_13350 [Streptomyces poonensis]
MRPAPRTVPHRGHRIAATLAALFALIAVLLTPTPVPVPGPATGAYAASMAATTGVQPPDSGPRADDACVTGCTAQAARTRLDHLGERPSPSDHHATAAHGTTVVPSATTLRTPARSALPPASPGRTAHNRDRAPPAPTGT